MQYRSVTDGRTNERTEFLVGIAVLKRDKNDEDDL